MKISFQLLIFILIVGKSCKKEQEFNPISVQSFKVTKKARLSELEQQIWFLKDIEFDTIPGISLRRVKDSLLTKTNKRGKEVIVAILDSKIDINNENLQGYIWKNKDEIENNGIDDDQNGYIDDVHGWNFLGNKKGENANFNISSFTLIVKKYSTYFKDKKKSNILPKDTLKFKLYQKAKKRYNEQLLFASKDLNYANMLLKIMADAKKELQKYFQNKTYNLYDLDSLKKAHPDDKELQKQILRRSNFIKYGFTQQYIDNYKLIATERIKTMLNIKLHEREIQGDDPDNLYDKNYGNNKIEGNLNLFHHGTEVSSIISKLNFKTIRIMPISVFSNGNIYDKDIALAIRYAVDNGAKVINMSFGQEFPIHQDWVLEAMKYAEKHNVLIVSSSGNETSDLDAVGKNYPTNIDESGKETTENFLNIGGTTQKLNKNLVYYASNYGKKQVDIFAPGENLYVALPNNKHKYVSGTSLSAAVVSGVAALIYSYYPNLSVSQIKNTIVNSGVKYNVDIEIRVGRKKKIVPFSSLSKSGKIVNAYNALIMADSISKN